VPPRYLALDGPGVQAQLRCHLSRTVQTHTRAFILAHDKVFVYALTRASLTTDPDPASSRAHVGQSRAMPTVAEHPDACSDLRSALTT